LDTVQTQEHVDRVVSALEDILKVAIEWGGVARKQSYSDEGDNFYYPAFHDVEFQGGVICAWIERWKDELLEKHLPKDPEDAFTDMIQWMTPQMEEFHAWIGSLVQFLKASEDHVRKAMSGTIK
jgi:hypothetical protein